ncbi:MAG: CotH kinase family protein [Candidatus Izemoplasmatales bacterium]
MNKIVLSLSLVVTLFSLIACTNTEAATTNDITYSNEPNTTDLSSFSSEEEIIDALIYPHNQVIEVNIDIDDTEYSDLIVNATLEEYHPCNITYNGFTLNNVAIRTKGNSSLRDVARSNGTRFSYNIDLNYFEDQDLFGLDKLILNNLYMDPSMIAEYTAYEAMDSLGVISSKTTFIALFINQSYYGLYLSVEHVGNEFLDNRFGNSEGEFYKPEIEEGSAGSLGGASLDYVSDDFDYSNLIDKFNDTLIIDNTKIIDLMKRLELNNQIGEVFDMAQYLKYLAVSTYTVNLDSYQGGIFHNYYLYNNNGIFEWIPWDLNMAYNGFPGVRLTDNAAIAYLIDEPVVNSMDNYPLIDACFSNQDNIESYHIYMTMLIENYYQIDHFTSRVEEIVSMIDHYVESDPNRFYSYQDFLSAVSGTSTTTYSIITFVSKRTDNVRDQLLGITASTNNRNGNIVTVSLPR